MTDATENPLGQFLDGVKQELEPEDETPWLVYGPRWAQDKGADPPPEDIKDPVWAPSAGWIEKGKAPINASDPNERLALYAPDSMEEFASPNTE